MPDEVLYEEDGSLAYITLNRPEKLNTLNGALLEAFSQAVDQAAASEPVRAIILRGAGRAFSGGYDLNPGGQRVSAPANRPNRRWDPVRDFQNMGRNVKRFMKLWEVPKPVIAQVHGWCVGGGTDLALCSDLIFMADDAYIGYPPARVYGTPTSMIWVYRLGLEAAKRYMLTGDAIDAPTALRIGLVSEIMPADKLPGRVGRIRAAVREHPLEPAGIEQAADQPGLREHGPAHHADVRHLLRRHDPEYAGSNRLARQLLDHRLPRDHPPTRRPLRGLRRAQAVGSYQLSAVSQSDGSPDAAAGVSRETIVNQSFRERAGEIDPMHSDDVETLSHRIRDADLYFQRIPPGENPASRLRALEIAPNPFWFHERGAKYVVESVAAKRCHALGHSPPWLTKEGRSNSGLWPSGRLLLYSPDDNLFDGAADFSTNGFFDRDNIPPWGLWVGYIFENTGRHYLLSWIPAVLLDPAFTGIDVNPEGCIGWLDDIENPLTALLRATGLEPGGL